MLKFRVVFAVIFLKAMFVLQAQQPPPPNVPPGVVQPAPQVAPPGQWQPAPQTVPPLQAQPQVQTTQQVFRFELQRTQDVNIAVVSVSRYVVRPGTPPIPAEVHPLFHVVDGVEGIEGVIAFMRYGAILRKGIAFEWEEVTPRLANAFCQALAPGAVTVILPTAAPVQFFMFPGPAQPGGLPRLSPQPASPKLGLQKVDQL